MAFRIDVGQPLINSRSKIKNRGKSILSTTNISASHVIDIYIQFSSLYNFVILPDLYLFFTQLLKHRLIDPK